jgi:hypothetical protein
MIARADLAEVAGQIVKTREAISGIHQHGRQSSA